jgi:hypothetical protein
MAGFLLPAGRLLQRQKNNSTLKLFLDNDSKMNYNFAVDKPAV